MNFCSKCGRRRNGNARFCGGCGAEFRDPAVVTEPEPEPPEPAQDATPLASDPSGWDLPADATRWDPPIDATRVDPSLDAGRPEPAAPPLSSVPEPAPPPPTPPVPVPPEPTPPEPTPQPAEPEPDPFATWFAPTAPTGQAAPRDEPPGQRYQPDTMRTTPYQPQAYPPQTQAYPPQGYPPQQPGSPFPRPVPLSRPPRSSGGKKAAFILTASLVVLAAGGGAYALVSQVNKHNTAQSPPQPVAHASTPAASVSPSGSASASPSPSASASASPSPSPKPTRKPSPGLLSIAPGAAANPEEPQVEKVLAHYFQGINRHDYTEYASALDAQEQAIQPQSSFDSGYATTSDSGIRLASISDTGNGGLTTTVTFTSHQAPADSVDKSACNMWTLNLYLIPSGNGYLIGQAPPGYQPTYSDC